MLFTLGRADCPPGMRHKVLDFFTKLLSRVRQPILPHVHVYKPVHRLVESCGRVRAGPNELEEILFLCTLAAKLKQVFFNRNFSSAFELPLFHYDKRTPLLHELRSGRSSEQVKAVERASQASNAEQARE